MECERKAACIEALMSDLINKSFKLTENVTLTPKEWLMYYRVTEMLHYFPDPNHNTYAKKKPKKSKLREAHGYSVGDLAFIFMRSKATIHEILRKI